MPLNGSREFRARWGARPMKAPQGRRRVATGFTPWPWAGIGMELRRSAGGSAGRRMEMPAGTPRGAGFAFADRFPRGEPRGYVPASLWDCMGGRDVRVRSQTTFPSIRMPRIGKPRDSRKAARNSGSMHSNMKIVEKPIISPILPTERPAGSHRPRTSESHCSA